MDSDWIETKAYVGFCRRSGRERFRWQERRREAVTADPPSLAAMIRRIRVHATSLDSAEECANFLSHVNAGIDLAHAMGAGNVATVLHDIATLVRKEHRAGLVAEVDRRLSSVPSV